METKEKTEIVQVKKNEEEMEIDLFELMLYYKSRLVFVIGGFLIGAILMALVTIYLVAPKYTATAKLYMVSSSSDSIVNLTGLVFGLEHLIYAFVILIFQSIYSNQFMLGIKEDKILYINSRKNKEIRKFLSETYNYGITILKGKGGFSNKSNDILVVSIKSKFYLEIKEVILLIDDKAFITVCDSYETVYINKEERKNKKRSRD